MGDSADLRFYRLERDLDNMRRDREASEAREKERLAEEQRKWARADACSPRPQSQPDSTAGGQEKMSLEDIKPGMGEKQARIARAQLLAIARELESKS